MIARLPEPAAVARAVGAWNHEQHDLKWRECYRGMEPWELRELLNQFDDGGPRRNVLVVMAERGLCPGPFRPLDRFAGIPPADLEQAAGYVHNQEMRARLLMAAREGGKA